MSNSKLSLEPGSRRDWAMVPVVSAVVLMLALAPVVLASGPDFATLVSRHQERTEEDRRWFHAHPELSLREFGTRERLAQALAALDGIEMVPGDWGTGLVVVLRGGRPGPLIAWRADMDALPVTETTGLAFASTRRDTLTGGREIGVMHACGHDLHLSIALGAVRVLADLRELLPGSLLFFFQPAEEIGAGAENLLAAGLFADGRRPRRVLALHVHPDYPCGQVATCPGGATANVDGFRLSVKGRGGHGAYPHLACDPVTLAARMVLAFNSIVAREMDVSRHCVISVGSIQGGSKSNVIPDEVVLEATVRSLDPATRQALKDRITRTAFGLAEAAGAPAPELDYQFGTPAGHNDPQVVSEVREVVRQVLGPEGDVSHDPQMIGEDFALYAQEVPGCQFLLGVAPPGGTASLHSPDFNPDEQAIAVGMRLVAEILWDQLQRQ